MRMTWKTLTDLLAREFRILRRLPVVSFGFVSEPVIDANDLAAEELQCAARVDQIVRDFARTRRWPALDEKERFFLRERLRFAYEYACIAEISVHHPLSVATRSQVANEQRRLVEWLLIDVWRKSGVMNWLEPIIVLTRSNRAREARLELDRSE
jgi:hypothetical protein